MGMIQRGPQRQRLRVEEQGERGDAQKDLFLQSSDLQSHHFVTWSLMRSVSSLNWPVARLKSRGVSTNGPIFAIFAPPSADARNLKYGVSTVFNAK